MIAELKITVLADNYVAAPGLAAEHGLCFLIEADGRRILFDTGQGKALSMNLAVLGISLHPLDALVLSHGHYDHTGGLCAAAEETVPGRVYFHPSAVEPKFARRDRLPFRSIGIPPRSLEVLETWRNRVVWTRTATEVVPGVWCTGEIPRYREEPEEEQAFYLDGAGETPDPLVDDQALFAETKRGLVIVSGCAHAGVANTVDHVCRLTGRDRIHALAGGLHLSKASHRRLEETGNALGRRNFECLAPCHCTGMQAQAYLRCRFHSLVRDLSVGSTLRLP